MGVHGKYRPLVIGSLAALVPGAAEACRLALLLALDVSSSVDADEDRLQREGLARALLAPEVAAAILAVPGDPVALAIYEWSGRFRQDLILDWLVLDGPEALRRASDAVAASRRGSTEFPTALGFAVGHAATLFARAPACLFRTLDVSGDGINNEGFRPELAYRHFPLDGVTVNGLAILGPEGDVGDYYRDQLIRGAGAFVEEADGFEDFERAMRRKLVREVGSRIVGEAEP